MRRDGPQYPSCTMTHSERGIASLEHGAGEIEKSLFSFGETAGPCTDLTYSYDSIPSRDAKQLWWRHARQQPNTRYSVAA